MGEKTKSGEGKDDVIKRGRKSEVEDLEEDVSG